MTSIMATMPQLGKLTLDAPFFQAGLAGYSDGAMRRVARRHGCPYAVTEAMLDLFLLNGGKGLRAAELHDEDHPIAGQLMGSHPRDMGRAAKVLLSLGYDVIDVNLACPVKKIRKRCRGGHLMSQPDEAIAILAAVRDAVPGDVPCTVKLRRGSDDSPQAEANFHRIFEAVIALGYAGAVVHGRTVEQKYIGPSRWAFLRDLVATYSGVRVSGIGCREDAGSPAAASSRHPIRDTRHPLPHTPHPTPHAPPPHFLIGGSGDIWSAPDIFRMIRETGVQLVSVARGCIGNPWIFAQARALMHGLPPREPTLDEQRAVLLDHFHLSVALHGEKMAGQMMRKFGIKFARHHPDPDAVKAAFITVHGVADWHTVLSTYYACTHAGTQAACAGAAA